MKDKMLRADADLETSITICLGTEKMLNMVNYKTRRRQALFKLFSKRFFMKI